MRCAGRKYLSDQERREALAHLAPARRWLLSLLLHPGIVRVLLALGETWAGGRLLYEVLLKPLSLNSLNVRTAAQGLAAHSIWKLGVALSSQPVACKGGPQPAGLCV